jgi:hypothetical protein
MNNTFRISITKPNTFKTPLTFFSLLAGIFLLAITAIASIHGAQHGLTPETCDRIWWYGTGSTICLSFLSSTFNSYETTTIKGDAEGIDFGSEESLLEQCQKLGLIKE